jgi:hypothetical protein
LPGSRSGTQSPQRRDVHDGVQQLGLTQGSNFGYDILFVGLHGTLVFRGPVVIGGGQINISDPTPGEIDPATNVCTSDFEVTGQVNAVVVQ